MFGYTPVAARNLNPTTRDVGGVFNGWQKIIDALPEASHGTA
jgi:hypothetical protein